MYETVRGRGLDVRKISFKETLQSVRQWEPCLERAGKNRRERRRILDLLHDMVAQNRIPERPGRKEPRCRKRRPKPYQWLTALARSFNGEAGHVRKARACVLICNGALHANRLNLIFLNGEMRLRFVKGDNNESAIKAIMCCRIRERCLYRANVRAASIKTVFLIEKLGKELKRSEFFTYGLVSLPHMSGSCSQYATRCKYYLR
jgi:hypothetical protein